MAEPTDEAIFAQIGTAMTEFCALLPEQSAARPLPFANTQAAAPPPSFRQSLKNHVPIGLLHPTAQAPTAHG